MEIPCGSCGAELRLNPNLQGTTVSCPRCGAAVPVPKGMAPPAATPRAGPRRRDAQGPPAPRRFGTSYTFWLLGAQAALALLGVSCLVGAFRRAGGDPDWSYLREHPFALLGAGAFFLFAVWAAARVPVLTTLVAALAVLAACAWRFSEAGTVDLSRTIALSVAMLALWLALSHRRAVAR